LGGFPVFLRLQPPRATGGLRCRYNESATELARNSAERMGAKMAQEVQDAAATEFGWRGVYRLGGAAALIAAVFFRRNLAEEYLLCRLLGIFPSGPKGLPGSALDCFNVFHSHRLIGLTLLNLFDIVNYSLVALIFLGLYAALRRVSRGLMMLAMALALMGAAIYFASNQAFAMLALSDRYWSAATDAQRTMLLAAGEALLAIQNTAATYGSGIYISYLLVNVAGLIAAAVMLRSPAFGKTSAYAGIVANVLGLGYYVTDSLAPALNAIPISAAAPFLLIWYLRIGWRLLRLGTGREIGALFDSPVQ
jgi:hypothetical protein